jgi:hypothetical protein
LAYASKDEQAQLLSKVLAANDADADEEQIAGVDWAKKSNKVCFKLKNLDDNVMYFVIRILPSDQLSIDN